MGCASSVPKKCPVDGTTDKPEPPATHQLAESTLQQRLPNILQVDTKAEPAPKVHNLEACAKASHADVVSGPADKSVAGVAIFMKLCSMRTLVSASCCRCQLTRSQPTFSIFRSVSALRCQTSLTLRSSAFQMASPNSLVIAVRRSLGRIAVFCSKAFLQRM